jgi:hypothetical protein
MVEEAEEKIKLLRSEEGDELNETWPKHQILQKFS